MSAGWFRTSRRCSTTTPSCCATTCTASRAWCARIFAQTAQEIVAWLDATMTRPRARRLLRLAGRRHQPRRRRRLLYLDPGRSARRAGPGRAGFCIELLGHRRAGRHAPQPGQECASCEADADRSRGANRPGRGATASPARLGAAQAAGGPRRAAHALHRPHALYRLERDGRDGLPGDGAGAAHGRGAGVCAAHAQPAARRGLGRSRRAAARDRLSPQSSKGQRRFPARWTITPLPFTPASTPGWPAER